MKSKSLIAFLSISCFLTISVSAQTKTTKAVSIGNDECYKKPGAKTTSTNKTSNIITALKKEKVVACKITSPELQRRKAEVITQLKANVIDRKELTNGYQYAFKGSDKMLDHLVSFIKTERACCGFFTFKLSVEDEESNVTLSISGPKGAKEFIDTEMEL